MSYDMFGYSLLNPMGYNSYNMGMSNMTNSLYMMNFYNQLKNYAASAAAKGTDGSGNANGSNVTDLTTTDFQTAFNEAFRKALQESLGISETVSRTGAGNGKTTANTASDRAMSAQAAYNNFKNSYGSHPSRIWTSKFV